MVTRKRGNRRARMLRRLSEQLRRAADAAEGDTPPRSRVTMAIYRREPRTVVHAERDLSEWVHRHMVSDWESVRRGRNRH